MKLDRISAASALFIGVISPAFACTQTALSDQGARVMLAQAANPAASAGSGEGGRTQQGSGEGGRTQQSSGEGGRTQQGSGEGGRTQEGSGTAGTVNH